jgi:23S rRNA pseudouridine2457 synthase
LLDSEPQLPPRDRPIRFRKNVPTAWLEITLTEGKNRQVRRMTAKVGFPTLRLVRVAIAHLRFEGLQPGQWRDLTPDELNPLLKLTMLRQPQN